MSSATARKVRRLALVCCAAVTAPAIAQAVDEPSALAKVAPASHSSTPRPGDDLSPMDDEFDGTRLDAKWTRFDQAFGWPDKLKRLEIGKVEPGALHLQPYDSAWVRDLSAPFLFQTVIGDFDMRARVRVRGMDGSTPGGTWSLGGLMARSPNGLTASTWTPGRENWQFITTGVGHEPGRVMTETKATFNSSSHLKLRPFKSGWVELRLVRVGAALFTLARPDGGRWQVRDRFYRMDLRPEMQVGLIAYTSSPDEAGGPDNAEVENSRVKASLRVDMAMDVDWVRFRRPPGWRPAPTASDRASATAAWYSQVNGENALTDPNLPEADVLKLLGD